MVEAKPSPALLIVLSAPSGAGKTTLCENLLHTDDRVSRVVTCTTRPPRPKEVDGRDYQFLTPQEFERRVKSDAFLEHAEVYGNRYGTLKADVLEQLRADRDVLLNIDVQGAESVRSAARTDGELGSALVTVFLTTPTLAALEQRLRSRGTEDDASFARRLAEARTEIAHWPRFDYLILSRSREEDLVRLRAIVTAERLRQHRVDPPQA